MLHSCKMAHVRQLAVLVGLRLIGVAWARDRGPAAGAELAEELRRACELAGLDEGLLSFCIPTFSFIWRIPIRGTNRSDE